MTHYTTLRDILRDLLLDSDSDVAAMMDKHLAPDYKHCVNGAWSTRAEFEALVRRLRQTITGGTIHVHEELRHGSVYAERHTVELATVGDGSQKMEAFAIGEYAPDGRFLRLYEATFPVAPDTPPGPAPSHV